jgi:hypothetical protein
MVSFGAEAMPCARSRGSIHQARNDLDSKSKTDNDRRHKLVNEWRLKGMNEIPLFFDVDWHGRDLSEQPIRNLAALREGMNGRIGGFSSHDRRTVGFAL